MSWVDLMGDDRWSRADLERRCESTLASQFPDAAKLERQAARVVSGLGFHDAAERARWEDYSNAAAALQLSLDAEWTKAQLLGAALDVEALQRAFWALPEGEEHDEARSDLQSQIDGAPDDVLQLVATRDRVHAPQPEEEEEA